MAWWLLAPVAVIAAKKIIDAVSDDEDSGYYDDDDEDERRRELEAKKEGERREREQKQKLKSARQEFKRLAALRGAEVAQTLPSNLLAIKAEGDFVINRKIKDDLDFDAKRAIDASYELKEIERLVRAVLETGHEDFNFFYESEIDDIVKNIAYFSDLYGLKYQIQPKLLSLKEAAEKNNDALNRLRKLKESVGYLNG